MKVLKENIHSHPPQLIHKRTFRREFVINYNLLRRQLNYFQKAELGGVELAGTRPNTNLKNVIDNTLEPNDPKVRAKKVGISAKTYQRAKNIIEKETEELKKKVRSGKTSI